MIKNNSCSSKVLIAGGYSILFEGNKGSKQSSLQIITIGLVLSTSACYNSRSELILKDNSVGVVEIESKGFNKTWKYIVNLQNDKNQLVITEPSTKIIQRIL